MRTRVRVWPPNGLDDALTTIGGHMNTFGYKGQFSQGPSRRRGVVVFPRIGYQRGAAARSNGIHHQAAERRAVRHDSAGRLRTLAAERVRSRIKVTRKSDPPSVVRRTGPSGCVRGVSGYPSSPLIFHLMQVPPTDRAGTSLSRRTGRPYGADGAESCGSGPRARTGASLQAMAARRGS